MCDKQKNLQDEILANFNICIEEMRFFKKQQWQVTYYCLLLLTAILFLQDYISDYFLTIFTGIVFVIGILLLLDINRSLCKHRTIIANIQQRYFENETLRYLNMTNKDFDYYRSLIYDWKYLGVFILVLAIACLVVLYAVLTWI